MWMTSQLVGLVALEHHPAPDAVVGAGAGGVVTALHAHRAASTGLFGLSVAAASQWEESVVPHSSTCGVLHPDFVTQKVAEEFDQSLAGRFDGCVRAAGGLLGAVGFGGSIVSTVTVPGSTDSASTIG